MYGGEFCVRKFLFFVLFKVILNYSVQAERQAEFLKVALQSPSK